MATGPGLRASESKEGYMFKEGGNRKSWKRRYFVLKDNKMEYFKSPGDKKPKHTINLYDGKGVRERSQCQCEWPSGAVPDYCFGLATKSRTYYFHITAEDGSAGDWKRLIQDIIEKVGTPNSDWTKDHHGKPEETKSFITRKVFSIGSKLTKEAMKHAPVDDRVKRSVTAAANMVEAQADADPHAGIGERAAMGVKGGANLVGATGVGGNAGKAATKVVSTGAGVAKDVCKKKNI